jgi:hypothetical protein
VSYEKSVFINCPFDSDYGDIEAYIIFTILFLGFEPVIASSVNDSGEVRMSKIQNMIGQCQYSIHDISRLKASKAGEFYRLNMPLELGIDMGARRFNEKMKDKSFLVLVAEKFDYQAAASDLAGYDPVNHNDNAEKACKCVRDWLVNQTGIRKAPGATDITGKYLEFSEALFLELTTTRGFSEEEALKLQVSEKIDEMRTWISGRPS